MPFIIVSCALVSVAVGPFLDSEHHLACATKSSASSRTPSMSSSLPFRRPPMPAWIHKTHPEYAHVINSGSPAADPSAAERSAEYETLRCRPAGTGFTGPDYSMYGQDMGLFG